MMNNMLFVGLIAIAIPGMAQNIKSTGGPGLVTDEAVLNQIKMMDETWNARNIDAFCAVFTEDCDVWYITTDRHYRNQDGFRKAYSEAFATLPRTYRHNTYPEEMIWLSPEICLGTGHTDIIDDPGNGSEPSLIKRHNGTIIVRVVDGKPKIQLMRAWTEIPKD